MQNKNAKLFALIIIMVTLYFNSPPIDTHKLSVDTQSHVNSVSVNNRQK